MMSDETPEESLCSNNTADLKPLLFSLRILFFVVDLFFEPNLLLFSLGFQGNQDRFIQKIYSREAFFVSKDHHDERTLFVRE